MGVIISKKDYTVNAILSGGSFTATLPLSNIASTLLSQVARTTNSTTASTQFVADLQSAPAIKALCLAWHNITAAGTIRIRAYTNAGLTTLAWDYTTNVWPAGFTAADVADYPKNWTFILPTAITARYWKIEISDTTNPAGYVEFGRFWIGCADFAPARSILVGYQLGWELRDVSEESLGGVDWIEQRTPRRRQVVTFPDLLPAESRAGLIMVKNLTLYGVLLFVTESTDTAADMLLKAYPARIKSASALTFPYFNRADMPLEVIEYV
jgi:hypothetical protein